MFLDKCISLDLKANKSEDYDWFPNEPFQVVINMMSSFQFGYHPEEKKFYVDT